MASETLRSEAGRGEAGRSEAVAGDRTADVGEPVRGRELCALPVLRRCRWCPSCRSEWAAEFGSCPTCRRWLGERPLERWEWQFAPHAAALGSAGEYAVGGGASIVLRLLATRPSPAMLDAAAGAIGPALAGAVPIAGVGWLIWRADGLRQLLLAALEAERRLVAEVSDFAGRFGHVRFRWGIWLDQYVLPIRANGRPLVTGVTAGAIFDFEPEDRLLVSETVYRANRRFENFVCVPRRLSNGAEQWGYRRMGGKRPSALDHAQAGDSGVFIGREAESALLDAALDRSNAEGGHRLALIAPAGAGKTRLVAEWSRRRQLPFAVARFSLFGGAVADLAAQLVGPLVAGLEGEALAAAVAREMASHRGALLVIDDIHWADAESAAFLTQLLATAARAMLVLLLARPAGAALAERLAPGHLLRLEPLRADDIDALARRLIPDAEVARAAVERAGGNPLFIEQFAAWAAESGQRGEFPNSLHQIIAARIGHLAKERLGRLRDRLRWSFAWQRDEIAAELDAIETEIALWLDRLETGDYADRRDAARYLLNLDRLDFELFLLGSLAGRPRPRSSRLREAIERLLLGSGEALFGALAEQAEKGDEAAREGVRRWALQAGDVCRDAFAWERAAQFFELALTLAPAEPRGEIDERLDECRRRLRHWSPDDTEAPCEGGIHRRLEQNPAVGAADLPQVWALLAWHTGERRYLPRALAAAEAIGDRGVAAWARSCAAAAD
jgi:hypothetical protein